MIKQGYKALAIVILLLSSVTAGGCWDRVELEDVAWVQAMGFDVGEKGLLATTLQIGIPTHLRGIQQVGDGPEYLTITIHSKTALEALDMASVNLGRRVSILHAQLFLFSEELARKDIRGLAGAMDRYREIRGTALVAVCRGRAEDMLRVNTSPMETSPSRYIQTVLQQHAYTGLFKAASFVRDFVNLLESSSTCSIVPLMSISSDYKPPGEGGAQGGQGDSTPAEQHEPAPKVGEGVEGERIPEAFTGPEGNPLFGTAGMLPKVGGGPVCMLGMAVFAGGRMVGTLSGEETRVLLAVQGDLERASYAVPDPERPNDPQYTLGYTVHNSRTKTKVKRDGDKVQINVTLHVETSYLSPKTQTDYTDPRLTEIAECALSEHIKKVLDTAIQRTQKEMRVDPFGFGETVKRTFWTWPEFEAFEWHNKYPDAEIATEVIVHVRRYGLDLGPLQVPRWERTRSSQTQ